MIENMEELEGMGGFMVETLDTEAWEYATAIDAEELAAYA